MSESGENLLVQFSKTAAHHRDTLAETHSLRSPLFHCYCFQLHSSLSSSSSGSCTVSQKLQAVKEEFGLLLDCN